MAISYAGQWGVLAMLALAFGRTASAETAFTPPERYPVDRYESEWNKNPFTLKTAPIAVTKASFAENLAIGSYYGSKDKPTVTVVNTKTGERTRLQLGAMPESGMKLVSCDLQPRRKDSSVVVKMGAEVATLHVDDTYLRQASSQAQPQGAGTVDPAMKSTQTPVTAPGQVPPPSQGARPVMTGPAIPNASLFNRPPGPTTQSRRRTLLHPQ